MSIATVPRLSIVIPTLNEGEGLPRLLDELAPLRGMACEIVVADGGSTDGTKCAADDGADRVVAAEPGRARQMNAGAAEARGRCLWFLHADSRPPHGAPARIEWGLARRAWGRFDVALSGGGPALGLIAAMMNRRSCWTGICTGDQGVFMWRAAFDAVGGFPDQPLMEDVAFSRRAKQRFGRPACVPGPLVTSSRRWERHGLVRTVVLMWRLRAAYALGASPETLHRRYYGATLAKDADGDDS